LPVRVSLLASGKVGKVVAGNPLPSLPDLALVAPHGILQSRAESENFAFLTSCLFPSVFSLFLHYLTNSTDSSEYGQPTALFYIQSPGFFLSRTIRRGTRATRRLPYSTPGQTQVARQGSS
jgi:hypothetical protein